MLSFLCEIIDGENVMRNYPSPSSALPPPTMAEQVLAPYVTPIFETESSDSLQFLKLKVQILPILRLKVQIHLGFLCAVRPLFSFQATAKWRLDTTGNEAFAKI